MELVERADEMNKLADICRAGLQGCGGLVVVRGGPGAGKTAFIEGFEGRLRRDGVKYAHAACRSILNKSPYSVIRHLLLTFGVSMPADGIEDSDRAFNYSVDHEVLEGYVSAILDASLNSSIILCVDDIEYADKASLQCLSWLVRNLTNERILVIGTAGLRSNVVSSTIDLEVLRRLAKNQIQIRSLSREGAKELLEKRFAASDLDVGGVLLDGIFSISGGNPSLVNAIIDDQLATQDGSGDGFRIILGRGFRNAVIRALGNVNAPVRRVAEALAVLEVSDSTWLLSSFLDSDEDVTADPAVRALNGMGLLGDGRFRHPAIAETILERLSPSDRCALHLRAAVILQDVGAPASTIAHHVVQISLDASRWAASGLLVDETTDQNERYRELLLGDERIRPKLDQLFRMVGTLRSHEDFMVHSSESYNAGNPIVSIGQHRGQAGSMQSRAVVGIEYGSSSAAIRAQHSGCGEDCGLFGRIAERLTAAESRVATLVADGLTNQQISRRLYITTSTVEQHLTRVYRKLGIKRRRELGMILANACCIPRQSWA
ncbi:AAA family ATPase [Nocardia sp. NPDC088792]|uniref:helix-turn-helix transcriptional regulator n=1 Tax=Nocardia sp. NPDC088792 TaxID=3364332 RepID=UPI0038241A88